MNLIEFVNFIFRDFMLGYPVFLWHLDILLLIFLSPLWLAIGFIWFYCWLVPAYFGVKALEIGFSFFGVNAPYEHPSY